MPSPIRRSDLLFVGTYAADSSFGSLNRSPRTIMAHAMRAILLASAIAATFVGRRANKAVSRRPFARTSVLLEDVFGHGDRGDGVRPACVKRQVSDGLDQLLLRRAVFARSHEDRS